MALGDVVLDFGLAEFYNSATHIGALSSQVASFSQIAANLLGAVSLGVHNVASLPVNAAAGNGRAVTVSACTMTIASPGTLAAIAIYDATNAVLLACLPAAVNCVLPTVGQSIGISGFQITLPAH